MFVVPSPRLSFKNRYQGNPHIVLLDTRGGEFFKAWDAPRGCVSRIYDPDIHTYVISLKGSPAKSLTLPASKKTALGLVHSTICFQVILPAKRAFSIALTTRDTGNSVRRIIFSTAFRSPNLSLLDAHVPLRLAPERWYTVAVHLPGVVRALFGANHAELDRISIAPVVRLLRVFSLIEAPPPTTEFYDRLADGLWRRSSQLLPPAFEEYDGAIPPELAVPAPCASETLVVGRGYISLFFAGARVQIRERDAAQMLEAREAARAREAALAVAREESPPPPSAVSRLREPACYITGSDVICAAPEPRAASPPEVPCAASREPSPNDPPPAALLDSPLFDLPPPQPSTDHLAASGLHFDPVTNAYYPPEGTPE